MATSISLSNCRLLKLRTIAAAVCLVFCALGSARAQAPSPSPTPVPAADKIWTTVGSAGTVDETDVNKVFFDHAVVQMGRLVGNQPPSVKRSVVGTTLSAVVRYNVTPAEGLFIRPRNCVVSTGNSCPGVALALRFLDTGNSARVLARLIEVDMATGGEVTRLTFDSNDPIFVPANRYQVGSKAECNPRWHFDFKNKAYYVEATLTGSAISFGAASGIQIIKIDNVICTG